MHVQRCYFANPNLLLSLPFSLLLSLLKQLSITETTLFLQVTSLEKRFQGNYLAHFICHFKEKQTAWHLELSCFFQHKSMNPKTLKSKIKCKSTNMLRLLLAGRHIIQWVETMLTANVKKNPSTLETAKDKKKKKLERIGKVGPLFMSSSLFIEVWHFKHS